MLFCLFLFLKFMFLFNSFIIKNINNIWYFCKYFILFYISIFYDKKNFDTMSKKIVVNNSFFDAIAFILSFLFSFFRSIKLFFINDIKKVGNKNIFFNFLDFIFRKWSLYFWNKPSLYKITWFFGDILNSIFKNK